MSKNRIPANVELKSKSGGERSDTTRCRAAQESHEQDASSQVLPLGMESGSRSMGEASWKNTQQCLNHLDPELLFFLFCFFCKFFFPIVARLESTTVLNETKPTMNIQGVIKQSLFSQDDSLTAPSLLCLINPLDQAATPLLVQVTFSCT